MPLLNSVIRVKDQIGKPLPESFGLRIMGPVLGIEVYIHPQLEKYLTANNLPLPTPQRGMALIDTGASGSVVDQTIVQNLGVSPVGKMGVVAANGQVTQHDCYPTLFRFPGTNLPNIISPAMVGSNLKAMGYIALIGRELLASCVFIYNGPLGQFSLAL